MNTNTSKWAVEVGNANLSEAIQTIAFSYGYKWSAGRAEVQLTDARYLCFNPENKTITYSGWRTDVEDSCSQIVTSFDQVMNLFKNPPTATIKVGSEITVNKQGDVYVAKSGLIGSSLFDQVVTERNKFLGRKGKLPVVNFIYTSQSSGKKVRNVIVTEMNDEFITGLDQDDENRFKKFLTGKVSGKVELTGFVEA